MVLISVVTCSTEITEPAASFSDEGWAGTRICTALLPNAVSCASSTVTFTGSVVARSGFSASSMSTPLPESSSVTSATRPRSTPLTFTRLPACICKPARSAFRCTGIEDSKT